MEGNNENVNMNAQQPPYGYGYPYYPPPPTKRRSDKPRLAGGLLITAAILGIIMSVLMIAGGIYMESGGEFNTGVGGQIDISGMVQAADMTPLDNVTISITDTHLTVLTDDTGHYELLGVPGGYQEMTIQKDGYNTIVRYVFIAPDGSSTSPVGDQLVITDDTELNFSMTVGSGVYEYGTPGETFAERMGLLVIFFGIVFGLCAIGTLIGGFAALNRKSYAKSIMGAVLGIFAVGFGLGIILSIVALIVLLLSSEEFRNGQNGN